MIEGITPYPTYKHSHIPWLGVVPDHWQTRQLRTLARQPIRNGVGESAQPFRPDWPRYVRITDIAGPHSLRQETRASLPPEMAAGAPLYAGDLLLAAVGATYGKSYLHPDGELAMCFAGYLVRIAPKSEISAEFLSYWTESATYWDQVNSQVIQSTIQNFSATRVKGLRLALPPLEEQAAIVRFLAHSDRLIRRYIAARKKLIGLLNEQKQAIIHRTVTRGLDPNVSRRPSGVEWLGDVPEHWDVVRTRYVLREVDNRSATGDEPHLSMSQKLGLVPSSMIEQRTLVAESYAGGKLCDEGDLVLNRLKAHLGVFALAREGGVISPDYTVLRKIRPVSMRYLELILRSPAFRGELRVRAKGIVEGFWRLYTDDFYDIRIPLPPPADQERIVAAVDAESSRIDLMAGRAGREISLIREYRMRLVSDIVTGKLDVREAASRLPDELEEPAPTDDEGALTEAAGSEDASDPDATVLDIAG